MPDTSPYGQPIGQLVPVSDALEPTSQPITGTHVLIERLSIVKHASNLWETIGSNPSLWTYIPYGPFSNLSEFTAVLSNLANPQPPNTNVCYAITLLTTNTPVGIFSLINRSLTNRQIEIGFIIFSPLLQRTSAATETFYLAAGHVFEDCHYRRYVWKCDNLNAKSKAAAQRLGFVPEGVFRQDLLVKGRNRDTAWFSMVDGEWEGRKRGYEKWLAKENFGEDGRRRKGLSELWEEEEGRA